MIRYLYFLISMTVIIFSNKVELEEKVY